MKTHTAFAALLALACPACVQQQPEESADRRHDHHGHAHADPSTSADGAIVSLDLEAAGGAVHLLLGRRQDGAVALSYARSGDGRRWDEAVPVDTGAAPAGAVGLGDDAQLAVRGTTIVCTWSESGSGWGGSGPLAVAISDDGGRRWQPGGRPHDDGRDDGHGFADLVYDSDGRLHAV